MKLINREGAIDALVEEAACKMPLAFVNELVRSYLYGEVEEKSDEEIVEWAEDYNIAEMSEFDEDFNNVAVRESGKGDPAV